MYNEALLDRVIEQYKNVNRIKCRIRDEGDIGGNAMQINDDVRREFKHYQSKFKKNIEILIEKGLLQEAKGLLDKYEEIVQDDVDIYSIRGVIAIMEDDYEEAERVLNEGRYRDSWNGDILYNLAYLYEVSGKEAISHYFYKHAYYAYKNEGKEKECNIIINKLSGDVEFKILIGSCIRQKQEILNQFLNSIAGLDIEGLQVSYYFIDDNDQLASKRMLHEFYQKNSNVIVYETNDTKQSYICDDNTHHWKEQLIWRVAAFKDRIINYARQKKFDYLFLVDSDIILNPATLKHLIKTGRDIISEIFWTKWYPNSFMLPQVWLRDSYTQCEISREERIDTFEFIKRREKFLNMLKKPGIYEVGGLGACTLISKYAIDKGVNFKEIKNLSFWGEDRHFCIRAVALGLKLFADTHYPAYHIYREEDLAGVADFKIKGFDVNKKKIALVYTNLSGSNAVALYKMMPERIKEKYDIIINQYNLTADFSNAILSSDLAIFTEGNYPFNRKFYGNKPIVIDLWHGFPIKAMGYADKGEKFKEQIGQVWKNVDYISSYSKLFNEIMNRCICIDEKKYVITGAQRNDFLFYADGRQNIQKIFRENYEGKNIIFYMPTYRHTIRGNRTEGNKTWDNLFDFNEFYINEFCEFLEDNNCVLFVKLHPAEEKAFVDKVPSTRNIKLITNDLLASRGIDLYETLNAVDILITDYSSVYFDLLLLDTPLIFTPVDYEKYEHDRGFLLPYEEWTPGPKCTSQERLQEEILMYLKDKRYYMRERKSVLIETHTYLDGNSCKRTWEFIESILD